MLEKVKYIQSYTRIFIEVLFLIAKNWKQFKFPSTGDMIKLLCVHTVQYYLALKRNAVLMKALAWMELKITMLRSQTKQNTFYMIPFI